MTRERSAQLTLILSLIAAALALGAVAIGYVRQGDVNIALIAAGIFLLAFGFGAKSRMGR